MKKVCIYFLILFGSLSYTAERLSSSSCEEMFIDDLPLRDYVQAMANLGIHSTEAFFIQKKNGEFPDGFSPNPLRDYPELQKNWDKLWNRVHKYLRSQGQEIIIPKRPQNKTRQENKDLERLMRTIKEALSKEDEGEPSTNLEEDVDPLKEDIDLQKEVETPAPKGSQELRAKEQKTKPDKEPEVRPFYKYTTEERKNLILEQMAKDPEISIGQLTEINGMSISTLQKITTKLQEEGRLARAGHGPHGYWQILEPGETVSDPIEERKELILAEMTKNPHIHIPQLIEITGMSTASVQRMLKQLTEERRLARVGSNYSGYWEVLEPGETASLYEDPIEENEKLILEAIAKKPKISIPELAERRGLSIGRVGYIIKKLKTEERLRRMGANRHGYWKVLEPGESPPAYEDPFEKREELVLQEIEKDPKINLRQIAENNNLTRAIVQGTIRRLQQKRQVERVGSSNSGHWAILKPGESPPVYKSPFKEREMLILQEIAENNKITVREIAKKIGLKRGLVNKTIKKLQREERLVRLGPKNNYGYWKILGPGETAPVYEDPFKETEKLVLQEIGKDSKISMQELAEKTNLTRAIVQGTIRRLQQKRQVARVGSTNSGHWKILKPGEIAPTYEDLKEEREKLILQEIANNEKISVTQLAEITGLTKGSVKVVINRLREQRRIRRLGPYNHYGYWVILGPTGIVPVYKDPKEKQATLILEEIAKDSKISARQIAEKNGISIFTVQGMIKRLKKENRLARVESTNSGHWKILKPGEIAPAYENPKEEREKLILQEIEKDPKISSKQLTEITGISIGNVDRTIRRLKEKEQLVRIGENTSDGYWKILEPGEKAPDENPVEERKKIVFEEIVKNPEASIQELVEKTGLTRRTINQTIAKLKNHGQIERIGGVSGYYRILNHPEKN